MKAAFTRYGPPDMVEVGDLDKPVPSDNEVLIRVRSASVNPLDWRTMKGGPYVLRLLLGQRKPKIKPLGVEQAACAPIAGLTALQGLRDKGKIQPGKRILINGAAGGVGTFAVQIAKAYGAEVTGVCSTRNVEMVRSIGADRVIDYTREDFTRSGERYDLLLDNVGNHSLSACRRVLAADGALVMVGAPHDVKVLPMLAELCSAIVLSWFVRQKLAFFVAKSNEEDLKTLAELMAAKKIVPVIDLRFPLSEVVEALGYLEEGHARGKVVVTFDESGI